MRPPMWGFDRVDNGIDDTPKRPSRRTSKDADCAKYQYVLAFVTFVTFVAAGLALAFVIAHTRGNLWQHDQPDGLQSKFGSVSVDEDAFVMAVGEGNASSDVFVASATDCSTAVRVNNHTFVTGAFDACVNGTNMTVVLGDAGGATAVIEIADNVDAVVADHLAVHTESGDAATLRLYAGEHYTGFQANNLTEGDIVYTLPRYAGQTGQCLSVAVGTGLEWAYPVPSGGSSGQLLASDGEAGATWVPGIPSPDGLGQVLTSEANGTFSWQTPAGGGGGDLNLPADPYNGAVLSYSTDGEGALTWAQGLPTPTQDNQYLRVRAGEGYYYEWADLTTISAGDKRVSIGLELDGKSTLEIKTNRLTEYVESTTGLKENRNVGSNAEGAVFSNHYHNLAVAGRDFLSASAADELPTSTMVVNLRADAPAGETSVFMQGGNMDLVVGDEEYNVINVRRTAVNVAHPAGIFLNGGASDGSGVLLTAPAEETLGGTVFRFPPTAGNADECLKTDGEGNHHYGECGAAGATGPTGPEGPAGPSGFVSVNGIAATNEPFDGAILTFSNTLGNRWVSADYLTNYTPEPRSECYLADVAVNLTASTPLSGCAALDSAIMPVSNTESTRIGVTVVLPGIGLSAQTRQLVFAVSDGESTIEYDQPVSDPANEHVYSVVFTRSVASGSVVYDFSPTIDGVLAVGGSSSVAAGAPQLTTLTVTVSIDGSASCAGWPTSQAIPFIQFSSTKCDTGRPPRTCAYTDAYNSLAEPIPTPACGSGPVVGPAALTTGNSFEFGERHIFAEFDYKLFSENEPRVIEFILCNNNGAGACLFSDFRVRVDLTAHGTAVDRFRFRFIVRTLIDAVISPSYVYDVVATPLAFDGTPLTRSQSRFSGNVAAQFSLYVDTLLTISVDTWDCANWASVTTAREIRNVRVTYCL